MACRARRTCGRLAALERPRSAPRASAAACASMRRSTSRRPTIRGLRSRRRARSSRRSAATERLAPLELRRALLDERLHALAEVLRAEERQELEVDVVHVRLERFLEAEAHHALRRLHRERRVLRDLRRE